MDKKIAEISVIDDGNIDFSVHSGVVGKLSEKQFRRTMQVIDILKTRLSQAYAINAREKK